MTDVDTSRDDEAPVVVVGRPPVLARPGPTVSLDGASLSQ